MTRLPELVVGAGPSGLGCAIALAAERAVVLFDRLPVAGGQAGWRDREVRDLVREAETAGVDFRLGGTASRWDGDRLLIAAPGKISWTSGGSLFYAGGLRPATAADIGLYGERPAGMLPATVAEHLLAAGVPLWRRPLIVGSGRWARRVAGLCRELGASVLAVAADAPDWADHVVDAAGGLEVVGRDHVRSVRAHSPAGVLEVECDAVILASDPHPTRNVEGALRDGDLGVTFVQPQIGESVAERSAAGREIALQWLRLNGGQT
jgi:hypothetical protein